jgi:hypothetical protein
MTAERRRDSMKLAFVLVCVVAGLLLLTAAHSHRGQAALSGSAEPTPAKAQSANGKRMPVLVELFTSEGCSSCPPADALVARLEKTQPVAGAEVVALKEHVDYWNHLGWRDPFSSAQFSERQSGYAHSFGDAGVYTPQMIVDGRTEFVGSDARRAQRAIDRAAQTPKAAVHLEWPQASQNANGLLLAVRIDQLPEPTTGDTPEVFLAVTEDNLHSDVLRGENAGSKFDHVAVVREFKSLGACDPRAATAFEARPLLSLANGWKRENLRAVVFVQERRSRRVLALTAVPVPLR